MCTKSLLKASQKWNTERDYLPSWSHLKHYKEWPRTKKPPSHNDTRSVSERNGTFWNRIPFRTLATTLWEVVAAYGKCQGSITGVMGLLQVLRTYYRCYETTVGAGSSLKMLAGYYECLRLLLYRYQGHTCGVAGQLQVSRVRYRPARAWKIGLICWGLWVCCLRPSHCTRMWTRLVVSSCKAINKG